MTPVLKSVTEKLTESPVSASVACQRTVAWLATLRSTKTSLPGVSVRRSCHRAAMRTLFARDCVLLAGSLVWLRSARSMKPLDETKTVVKLLPKYGKVNGRFSGKEKLSVLKAPATPPALNDEL